MASHLTLAPELDAFRGDFEQLAGDADVLTAGMTDDQFNWVPASGGWSVAQCIDHLNVTARLYLPTLDEGISEAIRRGLYGSGPFRYNWIGRMLVKSVAPPPRFKVKAPKAFQPAPSRRRQETLAAFRAYQVQFIDRLRQANGLDLARARVASPTASFLRIPLGSAFATMVAHERRHLLQARRVAEAGGFADAGPTP